MCVCVSVAIHFDPTILSQQSKYKDHYHQRWVSVLHTSNALSSHRVVIFACRSQLTLQRACPLSLKATVSDRPSNLVPVHCTLLFRQTLSLRIRVFTLPPAEPTPDPPPPHTDLHVSKFLAGHAHKVVEGGRGRASGESSGEEASSFLPSSLQSAQMTHVGVGIDVVWFVAESCPVGLFCFLRPI